jgi:integrase
MAYIVKESGGHKSIRYKAVNGQWTTMRLGEVGIAVAEKWLDAVTNITIARRNNAPHVVRQEVLEWAMNLGADEYERLVKASLMPSRASPEEQIVTLGVFLDKYFAAMTVKPQTKVAYGHSRRCLLTYFGAARDIVSITPQEAAQYKSWLGTHDFATRKPKGEGKAKTRKLSPATIARRVTAARDFFSAAARWGHITLNPFTGVKAGKQTNPKRKYFVPREDIQKVLEACPDAEWRLIVALSRFGGLRCPSEHLALRWSDVAWDTGALTVHSSKTEHHARGESRIVPLFPEVKKALEEAWDQVPEGGSDWVIARYRDTAVNLRTAFLRIIARAGVKVWPKLFHNLRASCETELAHKYPLQTVAQWIGHDPKVMLDHYLSNPNHDEHFKQAVGPQQEPLTQGLTQTQRESEGNEGNEKAPQMQESTENAAVEAISSEEGIGRGRIRRSAENAGKTAPSPKLTHHLTQTGAVLPPSDPDLGRIVAAWPTLSPKAKAEVLAIVSATTSPPA